MDLLCPRRVDPVHQSPQTRMYGYFTHGTVPPSRPCSSGFLSLPNRLRRLPSPIHFAMDTLPSEGLLLRPTTHYRRLWIWHPSFECQRDFNPPEQRAAQHTLRPLLTSATGSG